MNLPCDPVKLQWFNARCKRAGVPERHVRNLPEIIQEGPWRDCFQKIESMAGRGFIIALLGKRGGGKTQMGVCLLANIILQDLGRFSEEARQVRYVKALDLFQSIRDAYSGGETSESKIMASFTTPAVLVIDEAHERGHTDFESRTLTNIIDRRYDAMRDTLLIANLSKAEFAQSIGPSVVSRIHETGEAIECNWPSFREATGEVGRNSEAQRQGTRAGRMDREAMEVGTIPPGMVIKTPSATSHNGHYV